jgi:hypothetical protein
MFRGPTLAEPNLPSRNETAVLPPEMLGNCGLPLRWDNVEGPPFWVAGEPLRHPLIGDFSWARLEPGKRITLRLPMSSALRLFSPGSPLEPADVEASISDGSGLKAPLKPILMSDAASICYYPQSLKPVLVEMARPQAQSTARDFALFVSRLELEPALAGYSDMVSLPAPRARISRSPWLPGDLFWRLAPEKSCALSMAGPASVALVTRLDYPPHESSSLQSYQLHVRLDGQTIAFQLETAREMNAPLWVDSLPAALGSERTGYLEVPEGQHRLWLQSTAPLYVRLLKKDAGDYLLTRPPEEPPIALFFNGFPLDLNLGKLSTGSPDPMLALRDNRQAEDGLLGAMHCRALATRLPASPDDRAAATTIARRHSRYRNLLPEEKKGSDPILAGWFTVNRLLGPQELPADLYLPQEHLADALETFSSALFLTVPSSKENALRYLLPERHSPSLLRVVVDAAAADGLVLLQLDDEPPLQLELSGSSVLPPSEFEPSLAEAALSVLDSASEPRSSVSLLGALSPYRSPATILPVRRAEIPLPEAAKEVRLWSPDLPRDPAREKTGKKVIRVALQHLTAAPYEMTEMEYVEILRRATALEPGANVLLKCFKQWSGGKTFHHFALREVQNHWIPLFRHLALLRGRFTASVEESLRVNPRLGGDQAEAMEAAMDAVVLEREGESLPALEAWTQVLGSADPELRRLAALHRITLLLDLGELYLAEIELRGILLREEDEPLRRQAFEKLLKLYQENDDADALLELLAIQALDTQEPELLRLLAETLLKTGAYGHALAIGLSLPDAEKPIDLLLRCAFQARWWKVFGDLKKLLSLEETRSYWQGLEEARKGNYPSALRLWGKAGQRGSALAQSLQGALALRSSLSAAREEERPSLLDDWEVWQANQPGPGAWVEDPTLVVDCAGFNACYSPSRDLYEAYFRAQPGRPVKVAVVGPAKLRVEARPLHAADPSGERTGNLGCGPLNGWLHLRLPGEPAELYPVAIINNLPSTGIVLANSLDQLPGTRVLKDLAFGPGLHELEIEAPALDILVRPLLFRPEIELGVLPPLNASSAGAALESPPEGVSGPLEETEEKHYSTRVHFLPESDGEGISLLVAPPNCGASSREGARAILRARSHREGDSLQEKEAVFLGERRFEDALRLPWEASRDGALRRMTLLLYVAEAEPRLRGEARVQGEALFSNQRGVPGLQALHSKLTQSTDWKKLASFRDCAGLRYVEIDGWQPENPELRVRKAFLPPLSKDERFLIGDNAMAISMRNLAPTTLEADFTLETVDYLPLLPLTVVSQLDSGERRKMIISPSASNQHLSLEVPSGDHQARFWIEEPMANRFLRVRLHEVRGSEVSLPQGAEAELPTTSQRPYYLATPEHPLRFSLEGPAWLRIDELRDGRTFTRYRRLPGGWNEMALQPEGERKEALFRLFQKVESGQKAPSLPPRSAVALEAVPLPLFRLEASRLPEKLLVEDAFPLGGQEDGTLSLATSLHRRQVFEDDREGRKDPDHYLELQASHRYLSEGLSAHFETGVLARAHEKAGPTFGAEQDIHYHPPWLPFTLDITATAFVQWPDAPILYPEGRAEWSGALRGAASRRWPLGLKAYHAPSIALFGRYLSLENNNGFDPGKLDQDVFSRYKQEHKSGLVFSEALGYFPWRDTEWWTRIALASNEDLNPGDPDHLATAAGWRQFVGGLEVDLGYRLTLFFADGDRARQKQRDAIELQIRRDVWWKPLQRIEAGLELRHDLTNGENTGFIFLTWHFSNGRGYRDFWPGDVNFLALKRARVPPEQNNRLSEASHE